MMPRTIALLLLATLLAACGDDEPDIATIDEMRVVKVSGDQKAPVQAPSKTQASLVPAQVIAVQAGGGDMFTYGYSPEPLIARVVTTGSGGVQSALTAPISAAVVPAGTLVQWKLEDGCGELFAATTQTDDSAYTANRWAPGTKAGTCHAAAGRLVGTEIVIDATWELEVLPGPPTVFLGRQPAWTTIVEGAPIDLRNTPFDARDQYGNAIPDSVVLTYTPTWHVRGPLPGSSLDCLAVPVVDEGEGWTIPAAPPPGRWCAVVYIEGHDVAYWWFQSQSAS
nr:MAG: hypothetical protein DIU58_17195 [Sphaerobacter thermophilus]